KIPTGSDQGQILLLIFKARVPQENVFTAHKGIGSGLSHVSSLPKGTWQRTGKLQRNALAFHTISPYRPDRPGYMMESCCPLCWGAPFRNWLFPQPGLRYLFQAPLKAFPWLREWVREPLRNS
ncbi:MAG: hypothetical protein QGI09_08785, partial [Dehalococcoidia bacterium]|nr:hypothetical protein [Dehalococcoidia bacterium]